MDAEITYDDPQLQAAHLRARTLVTRLKDVKAEREQARGERDGAYRERAHLVALIAAMTEGAVIVPASDVDEDGWALLYLTIGDNQCSWHISPRDVDLFEHVEHIPADDPRGHWDGHTTEEKYEGIAAWTSSLARECGPACSEGHRYTGRCEGAPATMEG